MSKLLINEPPLQVLPTLAALIGLNKAIVLQQVHYWSNMKKTSVLHNGKRWAKLPYTEWHEQDFPFWTTRTIKRLVRDLEDAGLLLSTTAPNASTADQSKWYAINYEMLKKLITGTMTKNDDQGVTNCPPHSDNLSPEGGDNLSPCTIIGDHKNIENIVEPSAPSENGGENGGEKEPEMRDINHPYGVFQRMVKFCPGLKKGQTLKEAKCLLDGNPEKNLPAFSGEDIIGCARFLTTDPWYKDKMVTVTTALVTTKISKWVKEGKPNTYEEWKQSKNGSSQHTAYLETNQEFIKQDVENLYRL